MRQIPCPHIRSSIMSLSAVKAATAKNPINNFSFLSHVTDVHSMRNMGVGRERDGEIQMPHATMPHAVRQIPIKYAKARQQKTAPGIKHCSHFTHYIYYTLQLN